MNWRQTLTAAIILGLVAGAVVWWLERFQREQLATEVGRYLQRWDEFRAWESAHGGGGS